MSDIAEIKQAARDAAFAARKSARRAAAEAAAQAHLVAHLQALKPREVAGYLPIGTEIDPVPIMAALSKRVGISVPVVAGTGQPLRFCRWRPGIRLEEGAFGVMVPVEKYWVEPEVLIVPLLAFDDRLFRLGYGGGFYDRTLAALSPRVALGFAFSGQRMAAVPTEPTDHALDAIVTEAGVLSK